jgi:hypothetical protein
MAGKRKRAPLLGTMAALCMFAQAFPADAADRLDFNDVSVLFTPPEGPADLPTLISIADLEANGEPVWPEETFRRFVEIANGPAGKVAGAGRQIALEDSSGKPLTSRADWHIVALRVDAGAPGLSPEIVKHFGRSPQIRLTLQPVTQESGAVRVHDVTAHLIFNFIKGKEDSPTEGCLPRLVPDDARFAEIVTDLLAIKRKLASGRIGDARVLTAGKPLGVHPAFKSPATAKAFRDELEGFLERHLSAERLGAMAVMGLPNGIEPWIFLAMQVLPTGESRPVPGPTLDGAQFAQMLSFADGATHVAPAPATNNLEPVTCRFNNPLVPDLLPPSERSGVSTAALFDNDDAAATPEARAEVNRIVDTIADPAKSHFFNTDCVSCHTDTHRSIVKLGSRFRNIDPAVLPRSRWNVRNFGWFASALFPDDPPVATATRRARAETEEVLTFINRTLSAR